MILKCNWYGQLSVNSLEAPSDHFFASSIHLCARCVCVCVSVLLIEQPPIFPIYAIVNYPSSFNMCFLRSFPKHGQLQQLRELPVLLWGMSNGWGLCAVRITAQHEEKTSTSSPQEDLADIQVSVCPVSPNPRQAGWLTVDPLQRKALRNPKSSPQSLLTSPISDLSQHWFRYYSTGTL
jgi:hypothetical protein